MAFVLSGGASLGAIHVGTSAAALNGAFIASRPQTVKTADGLAHVWRSLRRRDVFPLTWVADAAQMHGGPDTGVLPSARPCAS